MNTVPARAGRLLVAGTAFALVAAAAGCTSLGSSVTASPSVTTPGAQSSSAQGTASTGTSTSAGGATASGAGASGAGSSVSPTAGATTGPGNAGGTSGGTACSSRYLRADAGTAQGAAGSIYQVITFTNLNNAPCTLYGYPGVSFGKGSPVTQVGAAADRQPGSKKTVVTLAPHGVASATLRVVNALNFPPATCKPVSVSWLTVYPPNQTGPLYVSYTTKACSNASVHTLTIDVVKPGKNG